MIFTQVLDTVDRWVERVRTKDATFAADYADALVAIARAQLQA